MTPIEEENTQLREALIRSHKLVLLMSEELQRRFDFEEIEKENLEIFDNVIDSMQKMYNNLMLRIENEKVQVQKSI